MSKKTIIVACASSMITSTVTVNKIKEFTKDANIDVNIIQCKFSEVASHIKNGTIDLVVPTGKLDENVLQGVPMVLGTPFVTGVFEERAISAILEILDR